MSGLLDFLSGLFGGSPAPPMQTADIGLTRPVTPSFDQFNNDQHSIGGVLSGILARGIGPGLSQAFTPDSYNAALYNQLLGQGQGVETGRLNLAPYEGLPYGNLSPQQMKSPASGLLASVDPSALPAAPAGTIPGTSLQWGGGGEGGSPTLMSSLADPNADAATPQAMPASGGGFGPQQIMRAIEFNRRSPAGTAANAPWLSLYEKMLESGKGTDASGRVITLPGEAEAETGAALRKEGLVTNGLDLTNPAAVNAASAMRKGSDAYAGAAGAAPVTVAVKNAEPQNVRENSELVRQGFSLPPNPYANGAGSAFSGIAFNPAGSAPAAARGPAPNASTAAAVPAGGGSSKAGGDSNLTVTGIPGGGISFRNDGTIRTTTENNEKLFQELQDFAIGNKSAEQNIRNAADAFRHFTSGSGTEMSAEAAGWLKKVGIDPASYKLSDPASVQIAKKAVIQAIFSQMSGIKNPALGEFQLAEKAAGQPDFQPEAAKAIFASALGKMAMQNDQFQNMANYRKDRGTLRGYDPSEFLGNANTQGYQDNALKSLPTFGGEQKITPDNAVAAQRLRENYRLLSPSDQNTQRGDFIKKLRALGYQ